MRLAKLFLLIFFPVLLNAQDTRLFRYPNASETEIAFTHAGDVYIVPISGGLARKVTSSDGEEMFPRFSPDGRTLAFTAEYDGNREIYTIPSIGGIPSRLTFSMDIPGLPERMGPDKIIMQWVNNGSDILYRTRAESWHAWTGKLFTVNTGVAGAAKATAVGTPSFYRQNEPMPQQVPVSVAGFASLSPDGSRMAYNRIFREFRTWKRYRGGQADDIWIYNFSTKELENITNDPAQDIIPIWYGDKIYYMSDRDHTMNLFSYDLKTKQTKKVTNFNEYDVKFPSWGPKYIAFENGGYVYLMDPSTDEVRKVDIQVTGDYPDARARFVKAADKIASYEIAPDGARALFSAHGDIFTAPREKGNIRNLTNSPGAHDRAAKWSPDGQYIAYLSDKSGEYEIYVVKPDGKDEVRLTEGLGNYPYDIMWSPDSRKIAFSDKNMNLYYINVASKQKTLVDNSKVWEITEYSWSPDSKWLVYTDYIENSIPVIKLYNLEQNKITQITDIFFANYNPIFSRDGKYLFFVSDRTFNASIDKLDWNFGYADLSKIYAYTLQAETPSPFAFESDEVNKPEEKKSKKEDPKPLRIDFENLSSRIIELPVEAANYSNLYSHKDNRIYYIKSKTAAAPALYYFDMEKKEEKKLADAGGYEISEDGEYILYPKEGKYIISKLKETLDKEPLNLSAMEVWVDKDKEWAQIFNEGWRQMRDFFYAPNMHGVDWKAIRDKYSALLPYVRHRADLTYIMGEMIGELNVGHAYVGGGEMPSVAKTGIGMLGAEFSYQPSCDCYRIDKIYEGQNWASSRRSPLTEPGITIKEGDLLTEIDGIRLNKEVTPYEALVNKADKFVELKFAAAGPAPATKSFTVKTISSEAGLRYLDWIEGNRRYVDSVTNGRIGYIHIPDMGVDNGLNEFVKGFFPQARKEGLIIDDRYNGGGNVSPMIIERLRRELGIAEIARNQQLVMTKPQTVVTGPLVTLINELSASDGDLFPYQFKQYNLGPLIGKRSWGGVIGIRGSLPFLDGGYLMKPEFANFGPDGTWVLEGTGMTPDIEIDNHPRDIMRGYDAQLNKGIEVIMNLLKDYPKRKIPAIPVYPDKSK